MRISDALWLMPLVVACSDDHGHGADVEADTTPALVCDPVVGPTATRPLVDHARWTVVPAESDPWAERRPAELDCSEPGKLEVFGEYPALEVNTIRCDYTTLSQPTLADACAGETFFVWVWNYALTAPEGAKAYVAVQIGDDRVWEKELPIPSPAGLAYDHLILPHDVPMGTPIYFHVDNHGNNQYELLDLSIVNPSHAD